MLVYFILFTPSCYSILGIVPCIFPVYYFLFRCRHPRWPFSQKRINIPLFELVVTCIETHILVTNFSISHKFPSVIICFFCFLLLGHIFPLNIQQSKICIQHNLYTIFDKMSIVSCCVFSHTRIQCMTLTTREFFYLPSVNSRGCIYWYRFQR